EVHASMAQAEMSWAIPQQRELHEPVSAPRDWSADRISTLEEFDLFLDLDERERVELAAQLELHRFPAGTPVVREGEPGDSMYWVLEGALEVSITAEPSGPLLLSHEGAAPVAAPTLTQTREQLTVGQLRAGDFFGENALLTGTPRTATVTASAESICFSLNKESLTPILQARPELAELLSDAYLRRKNSSTARLQGLSQVAIASTDSAPAILQKIRSFFGLDS
ncbi:MAG: cyclic nucleotide-binding domain-containing protein, partial [Myxococcota bacterium]|nr:cyclic nucleotide-binding domain-containing protein [Myxococcota bacterium]